jgi:hypothetical protein
MGRVVPLTQGIVSRVMLSRVVPLFIATLLLVATGTMRAQDAVAPSAPSLQDTGHDTLQNSGQDIGGPQDWSNRHVIYTRNGSAEDMLKVRDDPRFQSGAIQRYLREHGTGFSESGFGSGLEALPPWDPIGYDPASVSTYNLKRPKGDWSVSLGPTGGMAMGESPAVHTASYTNPSCSDFIVYTINATPSAAQANLIGFTNLYTNGAGTGYCTGLTGPSVLFAYDIGSGASPLSPVLSLDGTRVAWIENRTSTASYLHITIWVANQGESATYPTTPTGTFASGACTPTGSSCDEAIEYTNATYSGCPTAYVAGNGHSDLYVDYNTDTAFISANNGLLYHISNIFSTTTTPSIDFCIPVNTTFETTPSAAMSGPVYDSVNNKVYITDSEKIYAYNVITAAPAGFTLSASYTYGNSGSNYNYQTGPGPVVDVFNGYVYVFSTYDAAGDTSVTQLPTSLASGAPVELGPKSTNVNPLLFYGAFDNNYFNYGPESALSTLYSCGTDSTTKTAQDLFSISFNPSTGVVNSTPAMSYNTNVNPGGTAGLCSPLTEFYDGTTDRLFVGMGEAGATTGSNVVTMWNINNQLTNTSGSGGGLPTYTADATGYEGGTSSMAADNNASGTAQAENIYFSTEDIGTAATNVAATGTGTTAYNVTGIYTNGSTFPQTAGLDNDGNAYSETEIGTTITWNGNTFNIGPANAVDVWSNTTIKLPSGSYSTLQILAAAVNGNQTAQTFTVTYTDNSTTTFSQNVSDWFTGPVPYAVESIASTMTYENTYNGGERVHATYVYGYQFAINANKTVKNLILPANRDVCVLAVSLSTGCGGKDYCAVKLTQSALQ